MVLRNWIEGWFSRRPSRHARKNRSFNFQPQAGLESLEIRTLLTDPTFGYALDLGGTNSDKITSVAPDSEGNIYVGGRFSGTVDFDPSANTNELTSSTDAPAFVAKYDAGGNFLWVRQVPAFTSDISVANNLGFGGVFITANFMGSFDFDPGPADRTLNSPGKASAYVAAYQPDGTVKWAKMMGGAPLTPVAITSDITGNIYTTGLLSTGTADMDPGAGTFNLTNSSTVGNANHYVSKLTSLGNFVWADQFVDLSTDPVASTPYSIAVDGARNVYISGYYEGPMDFDPDSVNTAIRDTNSALDDAYLIQLTSTGTLGYIATFENQNSNELAYGVVADSSGNAYVTGFFSDTINIVTPAGSTPLTAGGTDAFVARFDSTGTLAWAKSFGDSAVGLSIAYNQSGALYVGGKFSGTFDDNLPAGLTLTANGSFDNFLMQLDPGGNVNWAVSWGGTQSDSLARIAVDGFGDVYTAGTFAGSQDFDPTSSTTTLTSQGLDDGFISKLKQQLVRPIVGNDSYSIPQGGTLNVPVPGILSNDSSPSGNPLIAGFFKSLTPLGTGSISYAFDGQIVFTPETSFVGVFKAQYQAIDGGTYSDPAFINIYVGVNGSPNLNPAGDPVLTPIDEDVPQGSNNGTLISDIIASMAPKGGITDPDSGALQGLAVIGANQSAGTWQFSTDGTSWSDFGTTSNANALLLASDANTRVRFLPRKDYNGSTAFCCVAWDQTDGHGNGSKIAIASAGGTTAFSSTREYPSLTINAVNDAPVLKPTNNLPQLDDINEDQPDLTNPGTLVANILARAQTNGGKVTDVDAAPLQGIAVIGANQSSGNWQYTTDNGATWNNFGSTSVSRALLLVPDANTFVRFQPKKDFQGDAKFTYIAWDQSDTAANGTFQAITGGNINPCSTGRQNVQLIIHPVNDAPRLNNNGSPTFDSIALNVTNQNNHGNDILTLINRMAPLGGVSDIDGQNVGIAVIGVGGHWQYSLDQGDTWIDINGASINNALLLDPDSESFLRLKPGAIGTFGITFVAWDGTEGANGTFQPILAAGGTTAFSTTRESALITVT